MRLVVDGGVVGVGVCGQEKGVGARGGREGDCVSGEEGGRGGD